MIQVIQVLRDNVSNAYWLGYSPVDDESGAAAPGKSLRAICVRVRSGSRNKIRSRAG